MSDETVTTNPPMGNTPEARTPDGTLKDVSPGPTTTPTTPETKPTSTSTEPEGSTFLTGKKTDAKTPAPDTTVPDKKETPENPQGAPEKYGDFKLPDGYEFDPAAKTEFETWAKTNNLSQEAAQGAIDIWGKHEAEAAAKPYNMWADTQKEWHGQINERFGGEEGADKMRGAMNGVFEKLLPPSLLKSFRTALDFTGAGSNPDLLEGLSIMLKTHMEGKPVPGGKPNDGSNTPPNTPRGPIDAAAAMYPHLVKNRPT